MAIRILQTIVAVSSGVSSAQQSMFECLMPHQEALRALPCPPCMGNPVSRRMAVLAPRGPLIRTSWLLLWAKAKLIAPSPKGRHRVGEQKRQKSTTQTFAKGHLGDAEEGRTGFTSTAHFRRTFIHHTTLLASSLKKNKCHDKHYLPLISPWGCSWTTVQKGYGNCEIHWKLVLRKASYETTGKENQPTLS